MSIPLPGKTIDFKRPSKIGDLVISETVLSSFSISSGDTTVDKLHMTTQATNLYIDFLFIFSFIVSQFYEKMPSTNLQHLYAS